MKNFKSHLTKIKAFAFDVDGVLSKQSILLHPSGDMMRSMNTKDGFAIQYAVKQGFPVAIITGGKSESIKFRFRGLGITDVYLGSMNKIEDFMDFVFKYGLKKDDVLYMGDDMPDWEVMQNCGMPTSPADAVPEIQRLAHYISDKKGGEGCVRDVIEQVLKAQNKWNFSMNKKG